MVLVVLMSGTVRNQTDGRPVITLGSSGLWYGFERDEIAAEITRYLAAGEPGCDSSPHRMPGLMKSSVLVAVAVPTGREAFDACRYAIDTLKHLAPIWKKG